jgi:hypothetical protein
MLLDAIDFDEGDSGGVILTADVFEVVGSV